MTGGPAARPHAPQRAMDGLDGLNPEQRAAVEQSEGPVLILAGAGSGKTRVIAYRIARLIGSGLAYEREVLAVTFTNKAAEEMRQRVSNLLGNDVKGLWISTFHALCAKLLRREGPAIGLTRDFVIYDSSDQQSAIKQALKDVHADEKLIPPRLALSRISQAKNQMKGPESLESESWNFRDQQLAKVFARYTELLKESGAVDFDDLLLKTVELFEKSEGVRTKYATQFRYIMIDEYQDTNRPQYLLVQQLASVHHNLAVVGDPDQSIYKWRGADVKNILDFERDHPKAMLVRLEQNYRSTQVILDAASAVIRQNRQRKDKKLWTDRSGGEKIVYCRAQDELEEADFVLRTIREQLADDVKNVIAVLYRINAQSRAIEDALTREGLPYRMVGGVRFYERKEVKDALAYLKLVINPHDDVSFRSTPPIRRRRGRAHHPCSRPGCSTKKSPAGRSGRRRSTCSRTRGSPRAPTRRSRASSRSSSARKRPSRATRSPRSSSRSWRSPATSRTCARRSPRKRASGSRTWPSSSRRRGSTSCASRTPRSAASSTACRCSRKPTRARGAKALASG
jgi:DNA helicase-2/ATP-dependent DNA helicase PcrA